MHMNVLPEAKPAKRLPQATPTVPQTDLPDETARLEQRARELDQEVQSHSIIGRRDGAESEDTGLLNRMLMLEHTRLIRSLQDLAYKFMDTPQASRQDPMGKEKNRAF